MSYATTPPSDVLGRIETSWGALQAVISDLTPTHMEELRDAGGWSIKDHLAHVAVWETSSLVLLERRSLLTELDLSEDEVDLQDYESINAAMQRRSAGQPVAEVVAHSQQTHGRLMAALTALGEEGLNRPYAEFRPEATENRDRPVRDLLSGNTYEHYDEHVATIGALLEAARS